MSAGIPEEVRAWLEENGHGAVESVEWVGGGCINNGARIFTSSGESFFLKTNASAPPEMFAREAEGLAVLAVEGGPRVPKAYLHGSTFLLLEDLAPAERSRTYDRDLGRQLAALHGHTNPQFGFHHDNYLGSTPQPNGWMAEGFAFFAERRLGFQARLAAGRGLLDANELKQVEQLSQRLGELIPVQPASLIHGDLWDGNAISDNQGKPVLIDPAAHYGWAEAELAMTALFGGFGAEFYRAYEEARPLERGWRERFPIYNLYHLLNHLNLFGRGYHGQVKAVLERFA